MCAYVWLCLSCRRGDRPDLRAVILPTLQQLRQRTLLYSAEAALGSPATAAGPCPDMFICPITMVGAGRNMNTPAFICLMFV